MSILRPALVKSSIGYIETRQMPDDKRQCILAALEKQLPKEYTFFKFLIPGHYGTLPSFASLFRFIRI